MCEIFDFLFAVIVEHYITCVREIIKLLGKSKHLKRAKASISLFNYMWKNHSMKCKTSHVRAHRYAYENKNVFGLKEWWVPLILAERLRANFLLLLFDCACRIHMERVLISPPDDSWFTTKTFHLEFRRYLVAFVYDTYTHNVKALHTPLSRCFAWIKHVRFLFLLLLFSLRVLLFHVFLLFAMAHFSEAAAVASAAFDLLTTRIGLVLLHLIWLQFIWFAHIVHAIIFSRTHKSTSYSGRNQPSTHMFV